MGVMNPVDSTRVRLDSWKAVAQHLGRSVRTVQRWESEEALPVHRLQLQERGSIFAYQDELDGWWQSRSQRLSAPKAETAEPLAAPAKARGNYRIGFAAGLGVLAVFLLTRTVALRHQPDQQIAVPLTSYPEDESEADFSPSGKEFAFNGYSIPMNGDIFVKPFQGEETRRLTTHPSYDFGPKWSPDGKTIAFWRRLGWEGSELILTPAAGGPEQSLGEFHGPVSSNLKVPSPYHTWMRDGRRLLLGVAEGAGRPFRLTMLSLDDHKLTPLFDPPPDVLGDAGPAISPDGRRLVFHRFLAQGTSQLFLVPVKDGWPAGPPRAITFDKKFNANPVWTSNSEIVFYGYRLGEMNLLRMSVDEPGRVTPVAGGSSGMNPAFSATGRRLAFALNRNNDDIWRVPLASPGVAAGPPREFIRSSRQEAVPEYSPDGRWLSVTSARAGYPNVWICGVSAPDRCRQVTRHEASITGPGPWSPDGRRLVFGSNQTGAGEIYTIDVDGKEEPRNMTDHQADESFPSWSRDGRWIYFASNRTGRFEVWKLPKDGGTPAQVTTEGGYLTSESFDGHWLYYTKDNNSITSVWRKGTGTNSRSEFVVDGVRRFFAMGREGVYYGFKSSRQIWYWEMATGKARHMTSLPLGLNLGLAISPDEREMSVALSNSKGRDIMMFENFR